MEEEILRSIDNKLNIMIKLLARDLAEGKNKTDAIIALASIGVDTDTIAQLVNTTTATVNARLWEHKKKGQARVKKTAKSGESR